MKRLLKEPLLHFLLVGGIMFALHAWLNRAADDPHRVMRITAAEINWLQESWQRQRQRSPSEVELRGIVAGYLEEQLLAKEAEDLGLDENDTIVRRRLAQKMEFLVQDTARLADPSESELQDFYNASREHYQTPARVSFVQIYFKSKDAAGQGLIDVQTQDPAEIGDRILLEREYVSIDEQTVANLFGEAFASRVFELEQNSWQGPVESGYGFHIVWIRERVVGQILPFSQVRTRVTEDWRQMRQARAKQQFLLSLLEKYDLFVDESVRPFIVPAMENVR